MARIADHGRNTQKVEIMSALSSKQVTSDELRQVVAYILDAAAMSVTITSLLEKEIIIGFSKEMSEIETRFPGFNMRLRCQTGKEVRRTISQRLPGLRHEFTDFLGSRLTPEDIKVALEFQRHRISGELRDPTFLRSLETDDHSDARLSERMSARMTPQQHAFVGRFLQSPCGVKLAPLTRQMEALKYDWMQAVVSGVSQRLPVIGREILRRHYARPTKP